MFKKMLKVMTVSLLALSLVACSSGGSKKGETFDLKLWGSQEDQAFLQKRVEDFKAANKDNTYNITLGVVSEADAKTKITEDLEASADVFAFANDQLRDLVGAGALYEITKNKDQIVKDNMEGSIDAVTLDGKMYGYPFTADNGYFMYYNSGFFSADDVLSLDKMLAKAEAEGKKVFFDLSNGWYISSFFLGAGGKLELGSNGKQVIDWNNETGVKVGEYLRKFAASPAFMTGDDNVMNAGAADGSIVAAVSGTWTADQFAAAYGDGYAATKLPEITIDGKGVQMASFAGYKVYGVNSHTKAPIAAMELAEFLSNEESQVQRFEARKLGPSNLKAAESEAVKKDVALSALAQQGKFAHSQKDVVGEYWGPAEAFGTDLENKSDKPMQELLDTLVKQIEQ